MVEMNSDQIKTRTVLEPSRVLNLFLSRLYLKKGYTEDIAGCITHF